MVRKYIEKALVLMGEVSFFQFYRKKEEVKSKMLIKKFVENKIVYKKLSYR